MWICRNSPLQIGLVVKGVIPRISLVVLILLRVESVFTLGQLPIFNHVSILGTRQAVLLGSCRTIHRIMFGQTWQKWGRLTRIETLVRFSLIHPYRIPILQGCGSLPTHFACWTGPKTSKNVKEWTPIVLVFLMDRIHTFQILEGRLSVITATWIDSCLR